MFGKFKISCDEATTICDKNQYGEASFLEKVKLNVHFLFCKICAKYSKQNTKMSELFKLRANECKKEQHFLTEKEKEQLKEELQKAEV